MESKALIIFGIIPDPDPQADAQFSQRHQADAQLIRAECHPEQARQDKAQDKAQGQKAEEDHQAHVVVRLALHLQAKDQENLQAKEIRLEGRNRQGHSPKANSPTTKTKDHFPKVHHDQVAQLDFLQSQEHLDQEALRYQAIGLKTVRRKYAGNG